MSEFFFGSNLCTRQTLNFDCLPAIPGTMYVGVAENVVAVVEGPSYCFIAIYMKIRGVVRIRREYMYHLEESYHERCRIKFRGAVADIGFVIPDICSELGAHGIKAYREVRLDKTQTSLLPVSTDSDDEDLDSLDLARQDRVGDNDKPEGEQWDDASEVPSNSFSSVPPSPAFSSVPSP